MVHQAAVVLSVTAMLVACSSTTVDLQDTGHFSASIPSAEEETDLVWRLLKYIKFYKDNNYELSLPASQVTSALIEKATRGELGDEDRAALRQDMEENVYEPGDYIKGYTAVQAALPVAEGKIAVFDQYRERWEFHVPPQYEVRLTLYGPGGSYSAKTGTIVMLTRKEGGFKLGTNPLDAMLHEAIHIGIEGPIVQRFNLSHWTKERIVDQFMVHHFKDVCPEYRMQPNAETGMDAIFERADVWENLPREVEEYLSRPEE